MMKRLCIIILCIILVMSLASCQLPFGTQSESQSQDSSQESSSFSQSEQAQQSESAHVHEFESETVLPVCTTDGYTRHICECGYEYIDSFVQSTLSHDFVKGVCANCGEIDYPDLINIISTETIKANVSVRTEYVNKGFGFASQVVGVSRGSGVIIKSVETQTGTEYYVVSNNHVVYNEEMEKKTSYTNFYIVDYQGVEYTAECIANLSEYDLSIMKFKSTESYTVLELEAVNSERGDLVVSLGQPEGQSNAITLGNVVAYGRVTLSDTKASESNVKFEVLNHDAYINNGSSGGALLDAKLRVIGINYAGAISDTGENLASYAIPVEKVYEFFERVGFDYPIPETDTEIDTEQSTESQTHTES